MSAKVPSKKTAAAAAKPGKDTIYVDVDDEITAIIDKVESSSQKIVALVLPKRAAMMQSIVNMRLLKRSATSAGKNVVLITSEAALLPLAGAAGLHVAKNLQSVPEIPPTPHSAASEPDNAEAAEEASVDELEDQPQKLDYNKPIGALAAAHEEPEEIALDNEEEAAGAAAGAAPKKSHKATKGTKVPNFDRFRLLLFGGIAALIILIILFVIAGKALPKATITLTTSATPVSLDTNLTASSSAKSLDENKKVIPAVLETSDQTATQNVQATGQQNLGDKATGSVKLTNCGANPVTVPAGTGINSNGLAYLTQSSVALDSGNFDSHGNCKTSGSHVGSTNITAQQPGTKYNASISGATIQNFSGVTASGSASGGTDNNVTVLQQSDVDSVKSKISSSDSDNFVKSFENQLTNQGMYVITSTLKPGDPVLTSSPAVGQQATSASVSVKITYTVLAVPKNNLQQFVSRQLNKQIDQSKEKISDSNVLNNLTINVQSQNGADAVLSLSEDTTAVPIIDENSIKQQVEGKKSADIQSLLNNYPGVKNVDVKFSPFWVSSAPKNPAKIKIVQLGKTGS